MACTGLRAFKIKCKLNYILEQIRQRTRHKSIEALLQYNKCIAALWVQTIPAHMTAGVPQPSALTMRQLGVMQ